MFIAAIICALAGLAFIGYKSKGRFFPKGRTVGVLVAKSKFIDTEEDFYVIYTLKQKGNKRSVEIKTSVDERDYTRRALIKYFSSFPFVLVKINPWAEGTLNEEDLVDYELPEDVTYYPIKSSDSFNNVNENEIEIVTISNTQNT